MHQRIFVFATLALLFFCPRLHAGSWSTQSIAGMNVELYRPDSAPQIDGKRALMISLHGCIQKASDLRQGGNWEKAADDYGMVVALPSAPSGGVYMGCWDYYGPDHTRDSRHDAYLIALVKALLARSDLAIDSRQVYLTGISSGGGEAMVMGCLAPDLFAGFGVVAGPSVGTSAWGYSIVSTSQEQVVEVCRQLAGDKQAAFSTQVASFLHGTMDYTVAQAYGELNGDAMAEIYGAKASTGTESISGGGNVQQWEDSAGTRVSLVTVQGLGHSWPAGAGLGGSFITPSGVDYPSYITDYFFSNNRRVKSPAVRPTPPSQTRPAGVTATLSEHILAGRLTYFDYATYYLKYRDQPFALYQVNGRWSDRQH